ncbi:major histocompatibility complex class I-related gene protein-like [Megalops cyprinoides]|uniref:major histocompatibility complex class I-related gene protein-like n=1 Tax=Megalops cyprinoides TaxID=118141 RepID=UPI001864F9B8|nr:major histocompatibility complex class I-related gene protein-like [Megalops cyprinoides]
MELAKKINEMMEENKKAVDRIVQLKGKLKQREEYQENIENLVAFLLPVSPAGGVRPVRILRGGSHSLWYFLTLTSGPTSLPELVGVEMVDDFPVGYYDSLLTYQRLSGCELDADGKERFKSIDAYNGEDVFVTDSKGWYSLIPEITNVNLMESTNAFIAQTFYQPWCISLLKSHLQQLKSLLNRKVHPRVRVIHKQDRDTGGMEVTCLATGFYPRQINMTLQKNGQPVPDQELTRGEPLPNGDGMYQLRRSLSVSAEELRERHLYTCTVTHSGVDNKLDVSWEFQPGHSNLALYGISFGVLTVLAFTIFGLCIWRKRDAGLKKSHQSHHDESSGASEPLQTESGTCEGT